ncbi:hypothetical protein [Desulfonema magnum]|uniref:Uncharacterized protein n=1 Tax=Desulfonema magnum TaxID=45655 RepID=A0A975BL34_9BACT|nr:hypothetical protein [Desulfonema magnum]QTA87398.1 Uncharacterized protein dnm_034310 [Desulfonema magnum]
MDEKSLKNKETNPPPVKGVITARKCECCGHHEIGIITDTEEYIPLKPGMTVQIVGNNDE